MKKLILSVAVVAAMSFASCGTSTKQAEDEGEMLRTKIENCKNPDSLKLYVKQAKEYAGKLVSQGNAAAAKAYLDEVTPVIEKKDPSASAELKGVCCGADSKAKTLAKQVADSTSQAVDSVKDVVADKAGDVKSAVGNAVEQTKEDVSSAADKAKEKVGNAAEKTGDSVKKAAEKTGDAVQNAAEKTKKALGV